MSYKLCRKITTLSQKNVTHVFYMPAGGKSPHCLQQWKCVYFSLANCLEIIILNNKFPSKVCNVLLRYPNTSSRSVDCRKLLMNLFIQFFLISHYVTPGCTTILYLQNNYLYFLLFELNELKFIERRWDKYSECVPMNSYCLEKDVTETEKSWNYFDKLFFL